MNGRLEHDLKREQKIATAVSRMPEFIAEWDMNMKACQKSTVTRYQYVMKVGLYLKSINENESEVTLDDLNFQSAQKFFVSLQTLKKNGQIVESSDSQKCTIWAAMQCMFVFLKKMHYISENPMELIDRPKNHDRERIQEKRVLLNASDFKKILQVVEDSDSMVATRDKAILILFMTTGMRKTALTEINIEDIDFNEQVLKVIDKRKKTHVYPLSDDVMDDIDSWIAERKRYVTENSGDALFITIYGDRVATYCVDEVVARYTKLAIGKSLTPHKLRAGYINVLYKKTHDLDFVCKAVGHASVMTTARYMDAKGDEREKAMNIMSNILS